MSSLTSEYAFCRIKVLRKSIKNSWGCVCAAGWRALGKSLGRHVEAVKDVQGDCWS
jgi:hypothetical protein